MDKALDTCLTVILLSYQAVIAQPNASLAVLIIAVMTIAFSTGLIKANVAPILSDQSPIKKQVIKKLPSGELVIVDPTATIDRSLGIYYFAVNVGSVFSIAVVYAEKRVGFWLAWLIPCIMHSFMREFLSLLVYLSQSQIANPLLPSDYDVLLSATFLISSGVVVRLQATHSSSTARNRPRGRLQGLQKRPLALEYQKIQVSRNQLLGQGESKDSD